MFLSRLPSNLQRQTGNSRDAAFPVLLIVMGGIWLLYSVDWLPDVHWLWILGLAGAGLAILLLDGITKSSIVSGPLLMLAGLVSYLREYHSLAWKIIIPVMLIAAGILQLIARSPSIPETRERRARREVDAAHGRQPASGEVDHD